MLFVEHEKKKERTRVCGSNFLTGSNKNDTSHIHADCIESEDQVADSPRPKNIFLVMVSIISNTDMQFCTCTKPKKRSMIFAVFFFLFPFLSFSFYLAARVS